MINRRNTVFIWCTCVCIFSSGVHVHVYVYFLQRSRAFPTLVTLMPSKIAIICMVRRAYQMHTIPKQLRRRPQQDTCTTWLYPSSGRRGLSVRNSSIPLPFNCGGNDKWSRTNKHPTIKPRVIICNLEAATLCTCKQIQCKCKLKSIYSMHKSLKYAAHSSYFNVYDCTMHTSFCMMEWCLIFFYYVCVCALILCSGIKYFISKIPNLFCFHIKYLF